MATRPARGVHDLGRKLGGVLVLASGDALEVLAGRLVLLNYRPLRATDLAEARKALSASPETVRAALVHSQSCRVEDLRELRKGSPLRLVAVGPPLDDKWRRTWRSAGAELALFDPFVDGELRFILNEVGRDANELTTRADARVPTPLMARVHSATGAKAALVYNLSVTGAYLETPRPTGEGGHVSVELPLPEQPVKVDAQVVSSNVPGNLQRPNLPVGMGVRFLDPARDVRDALLRYVKSRQKAYLL